MRLVALNRPVAPEVIHATDAIRCLRDGRLGSIIRNLCCPGASFDPQALTELESFALGSSHLCGSPY